MTPHFEKRFIFNLETAQEKVRKAQDLWNTKDPYQVVQAYTPDCIWRNRSEIFQGHNAIIDFLTRKWKKEHDYKLQKKLFIFSENKIAVQFEYEWQDDTKQWYRSYGLEHWEFADDGRMSKRTASINEILISDKDRKIL